jgi:DNA-directed RNA polymerase subunit RPC12/RpoP
MARCPNCGEKIDHLTYIQQATVWYKGQYDKNGYSMVFEDDRLVEREQYRCPKCGFTIAEDENEATRLLEEGE